MSKESSDFATVPERGFNLQDRIEWLGSEIMQIEQKIEARRMESLQGGATAEQNKEVTEQLFTEKKRLTDEQQKLIEQRDAVK